MNKIDNKLMGLVVIFFLLFGFFTVSVLFGQPIRQRIRANNPPPPSATSSLLVVDLTAQVGKSATATCIVRAADGSAIANQTCAIAASCGTVSPASGQTNTSGIASFLVTSDAPCTAQLTATVNNSIQITQTASIQFTP